MAVHGQCVAEPDVAEGRKVATIRVGRRGDDDHVVVAALRRFTQVEAVPDGDGRAVELVGNHPEVVLSPDGGALHVAGIAHHIIRPAGQHLSAADVMIGENPVGVSEQDVAVNRIDDGDGHGACSPAA